MFQIIRHRPLSDNRGNTFIEMTIVLLIVAIVSSISVGNFKSSYDFKKQSQFVEQLKIDLYYAQQLAMTNQMTVSVMFLNGTEQYLIRQGEKLILTRDYLPSTTFFPSTMTLRDIAFLPDGNIRRSGTIVFEIDQTNYKLVMLLGRGRFYIEKL